MQFIFQNIIEYSLITSSTRLKLYYIKINELVSLTQFSKFLGTSRSAGDRNIETPLIIS